jgi:hypothetical protein
MANFNLHEKELNSTFKKEACVFYTLNYVKLSLQ